ncbi:MAG: hypothetical protein HY815_24970 [Candidatus Riflebacteria bacterium]|nr:hypothetical protein [Candidatus Riflebacteria bacterium]
MSTTCQICGEEIGDLIVRCVACDTAHHEECFTWARGCSTYACGEVSYYTLIDGLRTVVCADPTGGSRGAAGKRSSPCRAVASPKKDRKPARGLEQKGASGPVWAPGLPLRVESGADEPLVLDLDTPGERLREFLVVGGIAVAGLALLLVPLCALGLLPPSGVMITFMLAALAISVSGTIFNFTDCYYLLDPKRRVLLYQRELWGTTTMTEVCSLDRIRAVKIRGCRTLLGRGWKFWLELRLSEGGPVRISDPLRIGGELAAVVSHRHPTLVALRLKASQVAQLCGLRLAPVEVAGATPALPER